ncbi:MAG: lipopolysaccharide heptosyltransferase II [Nitrospirae bacterium]|nr:lipopolysaccharide heptosyltransferase II [Nitrospirota bacterium]
MEMQKVLFFKPGAIGDLLHTFPALKALRKKFPAAHVTVVVSPGLEPLVQGTPDADRVQVFDKAKLKRHLKDFIEFGWRLRNERYDLFIDMQPSLRSMVLRRLSGARQVLVYQKQKRSGVGERRLHAADNFLETLRPLGIDIPVDSIELQVAPELLANIDRFLTTRNIDADRPLIALNCGVGAARPARNWFPERFASLADRLIDELDAQVIFVGGNEDRELVLSVLADMKNKAVSAAGDLSILESAALLARCSCLVSADTGPLHLATAVQTPVVGLFGSTDPRRTGPIGRGHHVILKGLACVPCEEKQCLLGTRACMADITVDEVFNAVKRVVGKATE